MLLFLKWVRLILGFPRVLLRRLALSPLAGSFVRCRVFAGCSVLGRHRIFRWRRIFAGRRVLVGYSFVRCSGFIWCRCGVPSPRRIGVVGICYRTDCWVGRYIAAGIWDPVTAAVPGRTTGVRGLAGMERILLCLRNEGVDLLMRRFAGFGAKVVSCVAPDAAASSLDCAIYGRSHCCASAIFVTL